MRKTIKNNQFFQNQGVKITSIVNSSSRPISINMVKTHLPAAGTWA